MATEDMFSLAAEKLTALQKGLVALVVAASCYSVADVLAGYITAKRITGELAETRTFAFSAESAAGRLRHALSHLYPERALGEKQRLTLLIHDIRRARRSFESPTGFDAALLKYKPEVLPADGAEPSRTQLVAALKRSRELVYFNGAEPGDMNAARNLLVDVQLNDLTSELSINQLPTIHVALLLLGANSNPGEFADTLEAFVKTSNPSRNDELKKLSADLAAVNAKREVLDKAFGDASSTTEAQGLIDAWVKRGSFATENKTSEEATRATKYSSPSVDSLNQLLVELQTAYISEESRSRGTSPIEVPGVSVRVPGVFFLLALPVLLLALLLAKLRLIMRASGSSPPDDMDAAVAEIKYGVTAIGLLGYKVGDSRVPASSQFVIVGLVPLLLTLPIAVTRGWWTLWLSVPIALIVLVLEAFLYRRAVSGERKAWPEPKKPPTDVPV